MIYPISLDMDLKDKNGHPIIVGDSYVAVEQPIGRMVRRRNGLVTEAKDDPKGGYYVVREWRADDFTGKVIVCRPPQCEAKTKPEELTRRIIESARRAKEKALEPPPSKLVRRNT